jgi:hypothetical protein
VDEEDDIDTETSLLQELEIDLPQIYRYISLCSTRSMSTLLTMKLKIRLKLIINIENILLSQRIKKLTFPNKLLMSSFLDNSTFSSIFYRLLGARYGCWSDLAATLAEGTRGNIL